MVGYAAYMEAGSNILLVPSFNVSLKVSPINEDIQKCGWIRGVHGSRAPPGLSLKIKTPVNKI